MPALTFGVVVAPVLRGEMTGGGGVGVGWWLELSMITEGCHDNAAEELAGNMAGSPILVDDRACTGHLAATNNRKKHRVNINPL